MLQTETRREKGKRKSPEIIEMAVRNDAFLSLGICHAEGRLTRILSPHKIFDGLSVSSWICKRLYARR
jgi:hypothetical protein